jgi:hypothetical protein
LKLSMRTSTSSSTYHEKGSSQGLSKDQGSNSLDHRTGIPTVLQPHLGQGWQPWTMIVTEQVDPISQTYIHEQEHAIKCIKSDGSFMESVGFLFLLLS